MTILSVAQKAALSIGLKQPDVLLSSTDRSVVELANLCNDTALMIAESFDWQALKAQHTITGDGTSEAFAMPSDYYRMCETSRMWSSRWTWAIRKVMGVDIWLEHQEIPYSYIDGEWIIYGDEFHFLPVLTSTETVKFFYIKNTIVTPASGSAKTEFTLDTDTFKLSERLLELGVIWRWKENKGLSFDSQKAKYDDLFVKLATRDGGGRSVVGGTSTNLRGAKIAFPQTVGGA